MVIIGHGGLLIPQLDKSPEEQDWDIYIQTIPDFYGHTGANILAYPFIEKSNIRWIEYDPVYEEMWKDMAGTHHFVSSC